MESGSMKAYVCRRYGGPEVVELIDLPKPTPKDREILVKICATTVTAGDWRVRSLNVPKGFGIIARLALGITRPRQPILGSELAGIVEAVGRDVRRFKPGDAVFAFPGIKMGCHAQYCVLSENGPVAHKPENLSFEEAAALSFGGSTALHFLRKSNIKAGENILIIGASGGVGTALVQLAKHFGATVTGVTSTANLALVSSLGADKVIDYTKVDITSVEETYDIIADTVGETSYNRCKHMLGKKGRFLAIAGTLSEMLAVFWVPVVSGRRVIAGPAEERPEFVLQLAELAKAGGLRPFIDRRYPFSRMVEAHAYVETRRKRGNVIVSLVDEG
jgi:NADPH:quinone reductase-like Zn-dependent oxidoreductase